MTSKMFFLIKNRIEPQQNTSPFFLCVARYSRDVSGANGKRGKQEVRRRRSRVLRNNAKSVHSPQDRMACGSWKRRKRTEALKSAIAPYQCGACERSSHKTKPSHLKIIIISAYLEELVKVAFQLRHELVELYHDK